MSAGARASATLEIESERKRMKGLTRVLATFLLALSLLAAFAAGSSPAAQHHARKHRSKALKVRILQTRQEAILKHGLRVKVVSGRARKLRLRGFSSTFDEGSKRLTKTRMVRFRRGGKRSVKLTLTKAGRRAIRACAARKIVVRGGKAKTHARLTRNTKTCRLPEIELRNADKCDFVANSPKPVADCMLPFPDDYYTKVDSSSETGRRINFQTEAMPANAQERHIEAGPYNDSNGFSQGSTILLKIPGIETAADVGAIGGPPINHIGRYSEESSPVVVIDANTGERWPIWTEIDSVAKDHSKALMEIHPAVDFESGHRYVVALRDVKNAAGTRIEAPAAFRYFRDEMPSEQKQINEQRGRYRSIFSTLKKAGIRRDSLYLAWDFTVATDNNNAHRELAMRNDAFNQLGDANLEDGVVQGASPKFTVTEVVPPETAKVNETPLRVVKGTFDVPCFLFPSCAPGGTMHFGANGDPLQNGTWTANFDCVVPKSATEGPAKAARISLYGHGLFGGAGEVQSGPQEELAEAHKIVFCATDEIGMSNEDKPNTISILSDLSKFPQLADRLQQGLLDELYLGRAMINPNGFGSDKAFHQDGTPATESALDTSHLYYNGNSQGGIMGGALTAVSPDFTRAALGVPAINYSVLLPRSVDFAEFAAFLYPSYPDEMARPLILDIIQMLWDRGDPNGYAHRMTTNPLPHTPPHQVVLNVAFGDHQVTDYQADVEARTIGASAHTPVLYDGRWPDTDVLWNVPSIGGYPFTGSAIYYWDIGPERVEGSKTVGVPPPPYANLPNEAGQDPHGAPRAAAAEQQLVSDFFEGAIQQSDTCSGGPCYAGTFTGP
jgi:hypothetical protein